MKEGINMENKIDVSDLHQKQIKAVQEFVELLRKNNPNKESNEEEQVEFGEYALGVKGNVSRQEIYEDR